MHIEVDQSGKIEQTNWDTALAFSDSIAYVILIPAKVKRKAIDLFRSIGKRGKRLYLLLFVAALYQLLKDHLSQLELITIDVEYIGSEQDIKLMLLNLIRQTRPDYPADNIIFSHVGKGSPAHKKALAVYRGDAKADKTLTLEELVKPIVGRK